MAKAETTAARLPRGAKSVSQAFFIALETIPEASRAAVAKAAQALIRDQTKMQRERAKVTAAKEKAMVAKDKARKPPAKKLTSAKSKAEPAVEVAPEPKSTPTKRRARKPTEVPVAA